MSRRDFIIGGSRRRLRASGVRFRPGVTEAQGHAVRFTDGTALDVGTVVWATGYRSDYSWIGIPDVIRDATVVHRRGVTDVPGLYFLGLSWQHTRGSALLGFVRDDAAYLASRIITTASVAHPSWPKERLPCEPNQSKQDSPRRRWQGVM
jgi:putative flavoprotein involved in K+ transport